MAARRKPPGQLAGEHTPSGMFQLPPDTASSSSEDNSSSLSRASLFASFPVPFLSLSIIFSTQDIADHPSLLGATFLVQPSRGHCERIHRRRSPLPGPF